MSWIIPPNSPLAGRLSPRSRSSRLLALSAFAAGVLCTALIVKLAPGVVGASSAPPEAGRADGRAAAQADAASSPTHIASRQPAQPAEDDVNSGVRVIPIHRQAAKASAADPAAPEQGESPSADASFTALPASPPFPEPAPNRTKAAETDPPDAGQSRHASSAPPEAAEADAGAQTRAASEPRRETSRRKRKARTAKSRRERVRAARRRSPDYDQNQRAVSEHAAAGPDRRVIEYDYDDRVVVYGSDRQARRAFERSRRRGERERYARDDLDERLDETREATSMRRVRRRDLRQAERQSAPPAVPFFLY